MDKPSVSRAPASSANSRALRPWIPLLGGLLAVGVVGAVVYVSLPGRSHDAPTDPGAATGAVAAASTSAAPGPAPKHGFQALVGKWGRTDGDYTLEIRSADAAGKLEAGYFNPRIIHIARAEASQGIDTIKVFVELQDVNYPGCTYTLTYDSKEDLLQGIYFQAAMQQTYDVVFERLKSQ